jgi:hypothetical protein
MKATISALAGGVITPGEAATIVFRPRGFIK